MLEGIKAVLFDLDGTLADSMWMWGRIDREYLGSKGIELPPGLQKEIEGMSFSETAVYFKDRFGIPETLDEIKAEWNAMARYKYAHEVGLKKGAGEFLEFLKAHDIRTGIATSNSRELLKAWMDSKELWDYFDCCITACEAGAGKPAPDIYLNAAASVGVASEYCLVFEDTAAGIRSGKAAGMKVCAVYDPYCSYGSDEIKALADYYIEDFTQVAEGTYQIL